MIAAAIDEPAAVGLLRIVEHHAQRRGHDRRAILLLDLDRGPGEGEHRPVADVVVALPAGVAGVAMEATEAELRGREQDILGGTHRADAASVAPPSPGRAAGRLRSGSRPLARS